MSPLIFDMSPTIEITRFFDGTTDAATASQRVVELGGTVVRDPWDSEFGRFAQVTDPLGGLFFLHEIGSGSAA